MVYYGILMEIIIFKRLVLTDFMVNNFVKVATNIITSFRCNLQQLFCQVNLGYRKVAVYTGH